MKSTQRNPFAPSCHCSGVARSDSKISAKALYGKWHCGRLFTALLINLYAACAAHTLEVLDFTCFYGQLFMESCYTLIILL